MAMYMQNLSNTDCGVFQMINHISNDSDCGVFAIAFATSLVLLFTHWQSIAFATSLVLLFTHWQSLPMCKQEYKTCRKSDCKYTTI